MSEAEKTELGGQMVLFEGGIWREELIQESERARGVFTFDRMVEREPERAELVLALLQEGQLSGRQIAIVARCSRNSVAAAMRWALQHEEDVKRLKRHNAALWGTVGRIAAERAIELLNDPNYKPKLAELAILGGTAHDKELVNRGEATQIRRTISDDELDDEYKRFVQSKGGGAVEASGPVWDGCLIEEAAVEGEAGVREGDMEGESDE